MDNTLKMNDQVTIGGQPSEEELRQLGEQGFKSVVNLRPAGEPDQPLSPEAEGQAAKACRMEYLHVPMTMQTLGPELVDQFCELYAKLPKPVFAHCKGGTRAGVMMLMQMGVEQGLTGQQALEQGAQAGFDVKHPQMREFIAAYIDSRVNR